MTRFYLAIGGVVALLALIAGGYLKGKHDGRADVQIKWDAAEKAASLKAAKARADAENAIPAVVVPDPPVPAGAEPCRVRDPYDRDCR